jgi:hypothetical protein
MYTIPCCSSVRVCNICEISINLKTFLCSLTGVLNHFLVPADGPRGWRRRRRRVAFVDEINKSLLCLTVWHMTVLTFQNKTG